ncbi:MAG: HAD-IA family hydrolase, partial [Thiotrichales bacterium]|nr:HAD-IA family hydrolase [Thiotrichales bacterium]
CSRASAVQSWKLVRPRFSPFDRAAARSWPARQEGRKGSAGSAGGGAGRPFSAAPLPPVTARPLPRPADTADAFLTSWRAGQLRAAALSNGLKRGRTSFHDCTALALEHAAGEHGVTVPAGRRDELLAAWYPLRPWPETAEVLCELEARGCRLGILSNGDRAMLEGIAGQLSVRLDHIFSTEESGVYKPAPEVYDLPARALGIAREDYLHVAGSANDVIGAKSAGVPCYWNNRTGDRVLLPEFAADAEGPDLRGVLDLV